MSFKNRNKKTITDTKQHQDKFLIGQELLYNHDGIVEVRVLGAKGQNRAWEGDAWKIVYGYFDDPDELWKSVRRLEKVNATYEGVYITPNPVKSELLLRAENCLKVVRKGDKLTADKDILSLNWLFIDVDRVDSSKNSAAQGELKACLKVRNKIAKFMQKNGWPAPIEAMSGNGGHLLFRLPDLENSPDNINTIKGILAFLADKFDTDVVKVDRVTYNPARLVKLYGTMVRKGKNSRKRPHRLSRIDDMPEYVEPISKKNWKSYISAHVKHSVKAKQKPGQDLSVLPFKQIDVEAYCKINNITIQQIKQEEERAIYVLTRCLFNPEHRKKDAAIIQSNIGLVSYHCFHNSCRDKNWKDVTEKCGLPESCWKEGPPWFTCLGGSEKFIPAILADYIQIKYQIINSTDSFYQYMDGVWKQVDRDHPSMIIDKYLSEKSTKSRIGNVDC